MNQAEGFAFLSISFSERPLVTLKNVNQPRQVLCLSMRITLLFINLFSLLLFVLSIGICWLCGWVLFQPCRVGGSGLDHFLDDLGSQRSSHRVGDPLGDPAPRIGLRHVLESASLSVILQQTKRSVIRNSLKSVFFFTFI